MSRRRRERIHGVGALPVRRMPRCGIVGDGIGNGELMRKLSSLCLAVVVSSWATAPCRGDLLMNGGFESPALAAGAFVTIAPGGEPAGFAWTVSSGTVDLAFAPISPFVEFPA